MTELTSASNLKPSKYWAIVPAAGVGKRMGAALPKQYLKLNGKEILVWTLSLLSELDFLEKIVLVVNPEDDYFSENLASDFPNVLLVDGGAERLNSVAKGLDALSKLASDKDWVLVHDAVRPCVRKMDINNLLEKLSSNQVGGILASPVKDTLKRSDSAMHVTETLDRTQHWLAATPQMFRYGLLQKAIDAAIVSSYQATDEAAAIEALGLPVQLVEGHSDNIKVTSKEDLALLEFILQQR